MQKTFQIDLKRGSGWPPIPGLRFRATYGKAPPRLPGAEAGGANLELGFQAGVYNVIGRTLFIGLRFAN